MKVFLEIVKVFQEIVKVFLRNCEGILRNCEDVLRNCEGILCGCHRLLCTSMYVYMYTLQRVFIHVCMHWCIYVYLQRLGVYDKHVYMYA